MKKLIFIDDSPADHFILKKILNRYRLDYEVSCTANGGEVIELLEKNSCQFNNLPDIILVDLYMPGLDGWCFLEKVERIYSHLAKPLKIYILSSSINPKDVKQSRKYACIRSFIFKPITKEVLEKYIDEDASGT